jgi:hypothetical protein
MAMNTYGSAPGYTALMESGEWAGLLNAQNGETLTITIPVTVDSTATDAGNTNLTTTLRAGLVMARKDSDGNYYPYVPTATDGTQIPRGILPIQLPMVGPNGVVEDKVISLIVRGNFQTSELYTTTGAIDGAAIRALSELGCVFDAPAGYHVSTGYIGVQTHGADYTVLPADNGKLLVATAAVTFTLPTIANGLSFEFLQTANNNMVIASAGSLDDIVAKNDAAADTLTFSTSSNLIGARVRVTATQFGATLKWTVQELSTCTMTVA